MGPKGLAWFKVKADGRRRRRFTSSIAKFFTPDLQKQLIERFGAKDGDLILIVADNEAAVPTRRWRRCGASSARTEASTTRASCEFVWVVDFPLFEWNEDEKRCDSLHHPFTAPLAEDLAQARDATRLHIRSQAYDIVVNGSEIGGGAIRIHDLDVQQKVFDLLEHHAASRRRTRFGFFLKALEYGAPPHGGIAFGLDRLTMLLTGTTTSATSSRSPRRRGASA